MSYLDNKMTKEEFISTRGAIVDEDDLQTGGSFGRIIGVVHCNGLNLNEAILDAGLADLAVSFCSSSEFEFTTWAQNHGC